MNESLKVKISLSPGGPTNTKEDCVKAVLFFYANTTHLIGCSFVVLKLQ